MKKFLVLSLFLCYSASIFAVEPVTLTLGPGHEGAEFTVYPAEQPNGLAIIGMPGGGYAKLSMNAEGHDFAPWLNEQGITYGVLRYRFPEGISNIPSDDARAAIVSLRNLADSLHINKVGVMGFSAGGHLASTVAVHYDSISRPDFQILFYPVITMKPGNTRGTTFSKLMGDNPTPEAMRYYSSEFQVTPDTPPAIIFCCTDDRSVPVANSLDYYKALVDNKVDASLYIFPNGGHGWGFKDKFPYKSLWMSLLETWLLRQAVPTAKN